MKKSSVLLIAGAMIALASCGENTASNAPSNEQIDSLVNARVEELKIEMAAKNDSIINAMAQIKADSIIAASKGTAAPVTATRPATPKPTKPTPKPTTPVKSDKEQKLDQMSGNTDRKTVTPQQTEEKKNKLDRMR